tara:strand:- start:37 stop:216 length:180 start_codon:yes stop_codon:yes gene_type:complete
MSYQSQYKAVQPERKVWEPDMWIDDYYQLEDIFGDERDVLRMIAVLDTTTAIFSMIEGE